MPSSQPAQAPSDLHYPLGDHLPALGTATEVLPGVHWIRMGLPFALDHINLWLLRDQAPDPQRPGLMREGWTIVDCGIASVAQAETARQLGLDLIITDHHEFGVMFVSCFLEGRGCRPVHDRHLEPGRADNLCEQRFRRHHQVHGVHQVLNIERVYMKKTLFD